MRRIVERRSNPQRSFMYAPWGLLRRKPARNDRTVEATPPYVLRITGAFSQ